MSNKGRTQPLRNVEAVPATEVLEGLKSLGDVFTELYGPKAHAAAQRHCESATPPQKGFARSGSLQTPTKMLFSPAKLRVCIEVLKRRRGTEKAERFKYMLFTHLVWNELLPKPLSPNSSIATHLRWLYFPLTYGHHLDRWRFDMHLWREKCIHGESDLYDLGVVGFHQLWELGIYGSSLADVALEVGSTAITFGNYWEAKRLAKIVLLTLAQGEESTYSYKARRLSANAQAHIELDYDPQRSIDEFEALIADIENEPNERVRADNLRSIYRTYLRWITRVSIQQPDLTKDLFRKNDLREMVETLEGWCVIGDGDGSRHMLDFDTIARAKAILLSDFAGAKESWNQVWTGLHKVVETRVNPRGIPRGRLYEYWVITTRLLILMFEARSLEDEALSSNSSGRMPLAIASYAPEHRGGKHEALPKPQYRHPLSAQENSHGEGNAPSSGHGKSL